MKFKSIHRQRLIDHLMEEYGDSSVRYFPGCLFALHY